jgi:hypothetical protein
MLFLKISRNNDNLVNIGPYYEDVNAITSRQCDSHFIFLCFYLFFMQYDHEKKLKLLEIIMECINKCIPILNYLYFVY